MDFHVTRWGNSHFKAGETGSQGCDADGPGNTGGREGLGPHAADSQCGVLDPTCLPGWHPDCSNFIYTAYT